ncbi:hypothetical protein [Brevibacillus reuszeri]|uniref:hypothetical protein n=1 Tax=Brevibacillus reuszeri TaxID=54915 RepID=UPI000CCC9830|nr:hypothetical protein [Brevibacillus reuszeri]
MKPIERFCVSATDDDALIIGFNNLQSTLKGVFHFFHSASVGVPKIFTVFSVFLSQLWVLLLAFLKVNQEDLCIDRKPVSPQPQYLSASLTIFFPDAL